VSHLSQPGFRFPRHRVKRGVPNSGCSGSFFAGWKTGFLLGVWRCLASNCSGVGFSRPAQSCNGHTVQWNLARQLKQRSRLLEKWVCLF